MRSRLWQARRDGFACLCKVLGAPVSLAVALLIVMMLCGVGVPAETRGVSQALTGTVKDSLGRPVVAPPSRCARSMAEPSRARLRTRAESSGFPPASAALSIWSREKRVSTLRTQSSCYQTKRENR